MAQASAELIQARRKRARRKGVMRARKKEAKGAKEAAVAAAARGDG